MEEDQKLYEKLDLPGPSFCPICRNQRRMSWRNDRTFYVRKCDLTGDQMISLYPEGTKFPVYHPTAWYSDKWDPLDYGQDYDFSRPFFEQWHELMLKVPRLGIDIVNCENHGVGVQVFHVAKKPLLRGYVPADDSVGIADPEDSGQRLYRDSRDVVRPQTLVTIHELEFESVRIYRIEPPL